MRSSKNQPVESIKINVGEVTLRSDDIMLIRIAEDYTVDIKDLKDIVTAVGKIGNGKKFSNLVIAGTYSNVTKDARDYSTSDENNVYTKADAFVIRSTHQKLLANLYMKINRPKIPTRFFDNEDAAVEWLKKYI